MKKEMSQDRVKGFLDVKGQKIVNGDGEEILLDKYHGTLHNLKRFSPNQKVFRYLYLYQISSYYTSINFFCPHNWKLTF